MSGLLSSVAAARDGEPTGVAWWGLATGGLLILAAIRGMFGRRR